MAETRIVIVLTLETNLPAGHDLAEVSREVTRRLEGIEGTRWAPTWWAGISVGVGGPADRVLAVIEGEDA